MVFLVSSFWQAVIFAVLVVPLVLIWLLAIVDVFRRDDLRSGRKVLWLLFLVLIPLLTPLIYFVVRISLPPDEFRG